ncbi:MAG: HAD family hydrolase [Lachnospiraceae bacterium]|nr:HAD family hydrolase [Lachnospiraceae bacterium]
MSSKILFTDIDDTLLNKDKSVSKENREAIRRLLEQGHYFVLMTGRPIATGRIVIRELELTQPGCYMAAYNGGVIYDCAAGRILSERTLPMEVTKELIDEAHKEGIYVQTYQRDTIITEKDGKELEFYLSNAVMRYQLVDDLFSSLDKEPNKVILINVDDTDRLRQFQESHSYLEERSNSFFSHDEFLEYCPKGINKGSGVHYISSFLGIPMENTVAVGDERNDIAMVRAAHVGVAVKNAHSELMKVADYVTEHDNEHGAIAEVIEKYILSPEEG